MSITPKERKLLIAELPGVTKIDTERRLPFKCTKLTKTGARCSNVAKWEFRSLIYIPVSYVCMAHLFVVMSCTPEDHARLTTWEKKKHDRVFVKLFGRERLEELKNEQLQSVSISD